MTMKLLVVDDHALFREGLRALLANISPGVEISEASSVEGAIQECQATAFRMVLLDLGLSNSEGLDTLRSFTAAVPAVPVIVLSGSDEPSHIRTAIDLGAVGYIPKTHTSELMIAALQFVLAGGIYLPPKLLDEEPRAGGASATALDAVSAAFNRMSPRQMEVAKLLLQGNSNKVIARRLNLSEGTIKAHVSAIFQVIGAKSRVEAVVIAAKSGIKVL
jgi:two-component system, NarL family, nitrate/nitrite response regulator NarL